MGPFQILLAIFLLVPLAEIYLLIQVGGVIGAPVTIALVVGTAVLGAALVRAQGLATWRRAQAALGRGQVPALEMVEGVGLLLAGALLLTPGFLTDTVGFACLVPPVRRSAARALLRRGRVVAGGAAPEPESRGPGGGRVFEGEFRREDPRDGAS